MIVLLEGLSTKFHTLLSLEWFNSLSIELIQPTLDKDSLMSLDSIKDRYVEKTHIFLTWDLFYILYYRGLKILYVGCEL